MSDPQLCVLSSTRTRSKTMAARRKVSSAQLCKMLSERVDFTSPELVEAVTDYFGDDKQLEIDFSSDEEDCMPMPIENADEHMESSSGK